MGINKKRLYVALYPTGVPETDRPLYHWAFLVGPKYEIRKNVPGKRYHVRNYADGWRFEERDIRNVMLSNSLIARIRIAKIKDEARFEHIVKNAPVVNGDPNWRCRSWVTDVLALLKADGHAIGPCLEWAEIEAFACRYVDEKVEAGRFLKVSDEPRPAYDLIKNREIRP